MTSSRPGRGAPVSPSPTCAAPSDPIRLRWALVVLLAVTAVFRFWYASRHGLVYDEAYYWLWARHLAPGFYDQGPGVALAIRAGMFLGSGPGPVRLAAVVDAAVIAILAYLLASRIFRRELAGLLAALFVNLIPLLFVGGILITHDSPQMASWAAAVYFLARALGIGDRPSSTGSYSEPSKGWWLLSGVLAGVSLDCKYTAVLFLPCALLALSGTSRGRAALRGPWPYLMGILMVAVAAPPVYWNATHNWASARHILNLGGAQHPSLLQMGTVGDYLGGQLVLTLLFFFPMVWATAAAWRRGRADGDDGLWLAGCFAVPVWVLFLLLSFHSTVEPNWPAPAYFTAAVVTPWLAVKGVLKSSRLKARALTAFHAVSCLLAVVGIAIILFPRVILSLPDGRRLMDRIRPKDDRTNEMYGWDQLADGLGKAGWRPGSGWDVAATRYQEAAELSFALPEQPDTYNLPVVRRRNQYDYWAPLNPGAKVYAVVPAQDRDALLPQIRTLFDHVSIAADVPIWRRPLHSRPIAEFLILKCEGYRGGKNGLMGSQW